MNLFPYAPHLGWHAVHQAIDTVCDMNMNTAAGRAMRTENLVRLADAFKPNVICGMNSYLRHKFLATSVIRKAKLPDQVLFINGAEKMLEAEREQIKKLASHAGVAHPIVLDVYAASELKEAFLPECTPGSGFHHIAPLSSIIRTIKPKKATRHLITEWEFSKEGVAAVWNIDGAGTSLQGYIIGDVFGHVEERECPNCKLQVKRIFEVDRVQEAQAQAEIMGVLEIKVKGTKVDLAEIREIALNTPGVIEAQVAVDKSRTRLEVRYVSNEPEKARKALEQAYSNLEVKPKLVPTTLEKLRGDKLKFEGIKL
ncbi:hypothetical protein D6825_04080 [Candidatus Woesearchaeota archaeon]|nr:MAG: hypothetical protein D6825_04080 [Candidatus Woesearchaeota archaeon]